MTYKNVLSPLKISQELMCPQMFAPCCCYFQISTVATFDAIKKNLQMQHREIVCSIRYIKIDIQIKNVSYT